VIPKQLQIGTQSGGKATHTWDELKIPGCISNCEREPIGHDDYALSICGSYAPLDFMGFAISNRQFNQVVVSPWNALVIHNDPHPGPHEKPGFHHLEMKRLSLWSTHVRNALSHS
jgi:hypothetical protein